MNVIPTFRGLSDDARRRLSTAQLRAHNASLLLRLVWEEQEISRAELSRRSGLSRSTVSDITADLIARQLVREIGSGSSRGGRRPILLGFHYEAFGLIGVGIGATHVSVALCDLSGSVVAWRSQPHGVRLDPQGTCALILQQIREVLAETDHTLDRIVGVGVGVPSPVVSSGPHALSPLALPAWDGFDLVDALRTELRRPLLMDNDANLGAVAERWWGEGADGSDLVYVKLGTGVGAGLLLGGNIHRGAHGIAGELGHVAIDATGPECPCGLRGCLVTLVGRDALAARVREGLKSQTGSLLAAVPNPSPADIARAAKAGDPLASRVVRDAGRSLGIALSSLFNVVNPATIVLGGALARAGDALFDAIRDTAFSCSPWGRVAQARIVASRLGKQSVALGAATWMLEVALRDLDYFPTAEKSALSASS